MADLFGKSSSTPQDANARKEAIMNSVRNELALSNAQQLMNSANERCYEACVTKPGTSLSNAEQTCLSRCLDRYMEAFNIVRSTYMARIAKERQEDQANVI